MSLIWLGLAINLVLRRKRNNYSHYSFILFLATRYTKEDELLLRTRQRYERLFYQHSTSPANALLSPIFSSPSEDNADVFPFPVTKIIYLITVQFLALFLLLHCYFKTSSGSYCIIHDVAHYLFIVSEIVQDPVGQHIFHFASIFFLSCLFSAS